MQYLVKQIDKETSKNGDIEKGIYEYSQNILMPCVSLRVRIRLEKKIAYSSKGEVLNTDQP